MLCCWRVGGKRGVVKTSTTRGEQRSRCCLLHTTTEHTKCILYAQKNKCVRTLVYKSFRGLGRVVYLECAVYMYCKHTMAIRRGDYEKQMSAAVNVVLSPSPPADCVDCMSVVANINMIASHRDKYHGIKS